MTLALGILVQPRFSIVAAFILIHDAARHDRERFIALGLRWITVVALTILAMRVA